jgi:Calcineurin-like phosphoesterase
MLTMKIAVMSDLHLELDARRSEETVRPQDAGTAFEFSHKPPQPNADLLIVAGDVHTGALGIDWVLRHFSMPAIVIGGNHEPFGHELFRIIQVNREKASTTNGRVTFLERGTWETGRPAGKKVRVIGATLWTDFRLYGTPSLSMQLAQDQLDDFKLIKIERGYKLRPLQPADTARLHAASLAFLRKELSRQFDGKTIVVTHHAPSPRSVAPRFQNNPLNPPFASNLEALIERYEPTLWIHGHIYASGEDRR